MGRSWRPGLLTGGEKREERRKEEKEEGREREKKREVRERGRREREKKKNFECARVFQRSKPDYIAFGFFVKHEKLPIYPF